MQLISNRYEGQHKLLKIFLTVLANVQKSMLSWPCLSDSLGKLLANSCARAGVHVANSRVQARAAYGFVAAPCAWNQVHRPSTVRLPVFCHLEVDLDVHVSLPQRSPLSLKCGPSTYFIALHLRLTGPVEPGTRLTKDIRRRKI